MVLVFRIQFLSDWNILLSLQQMPHLFSHIMVRADQDGSNWILDESGRFTLKSARTFFLEPGVPCGWGKFIWSSDIPPSKTLVLWKVFHGRLPTDQHIQCARFVKSMRNLFIIYF